MACQENRKQNGFLESFNGQVSDKHFNKHLFRNIVHARTVINTWETTITLSGPTLSSRV
ncbi:hypothetical protein CO710_05995 [Acetobacter orleanensis]|nr:hypothetical protein CO710_05995 [Acetobacter orleanensis]